MHVLALDTSTECCSAALMLGAYDVRLRSQVTERGHAELILPMIDGLLGEAGLRLVDLDGLAFGRGPGAFTGLRVAAGVIQGLGIGAGLLVAPVSSLAAVAAQVPARGAFAGVMQPAKHALDTSSGEDILVCNDARMGEVYWATYRPSIPGEAPIELTPERVSPPDAVPIGPGVRHFAGNGIARYPHLRDRLLGGGLQFHDGLYPRADAIARLGAIALAAGLGLSAELALPTYIRDDVARPSGATVTGMS
jgi:tRNA threonylcarbamoyladenosine biosynthesis protein TsaB